MMRLLLTLLLYSASLAAAVETPVEVRFLAVSVPNGLGKVAMAAEDLRSESFDLPMNNLSGPQTAPARVFRLMAVDHKRSLSTIKLPEKGNSFIALLVTLPGKQGYQPVVMPHNNPKFRPGDYYFHNLADKTVFGQVGTARFILPKGKSTIVTPKGARAENFYDVGLGVREKQGDRVLSTTRWPVDNLARFYVFFYKDPQTGLVAFRGVDEFLTPPQPEP